jgi:hypothetical protein
MQERDPAANSAEDDQLNAIKSYGEKLNRDLAIATLKARQYDAQTDITSGISSPDEFGIQTRNLPYFAWFVKECPHLIGLDKLAPLSTGVIYGYSANYPVLYHSILALSTSFVDFGLERELSSEDHIALVAPQIQAAISQGDFDDGHIFAVFLLGVMFIFRGQPGLGARYLHGMTLMVKRAETIRRDLGYDTTKPPLVELMLRVAMSVFIRLSASYRRVLEFDGQPKAELEEAWVDQVADQAFVDLTLETCKGNEFMFYILRLMHRAADMRSSPFYVALIHEPQIAQEADEIGKAVAIARKRLMLKARGPTIPSPHTLPAESYGPFEPVPGITNISYGYRIVSNYLLTMALTFIRNPRIGPLFEDREEAAIELCRHYATIQHTTTACRNLPLLTALWAAGLTLGPTSHPRGMFQVFQAKGVEYRWIVERLRLLEPKYYPNAVQVAEQLDQVWGMEEFCWHDVAWTGDCRFWLFGREKAVQEMSR